MKVTVCGAAGGIGQPLSLLLKLNTSVTHLALFDIVNANGVAADLSHINTPAIVTGHQPSGKDDRSAITAALTGADIVVIPAGVPRKPGMTRADLFNVNAGIIRDLAANVGRTCPRALVLIILNPVNLTVPIAAEVLKKLGVFDPRKLFGVTTLDAVRAETFLGGLIKELPDELKGKVSVVGGHSGDTIIPLINFDSSIAKKVAAIHPLDYAQFVRRVQYGGDEVVKAKNGAGSATLSMAYAGYRFAEAVINSLSGSYTGSIPDSAYVYLAGIPSGEHLAQRLKVDYFSVPVYLKNGQVDTLVDPFALLVSPGEQELVPVAVAGLEKSIAQGVNFVSNKI